MFQYIYLQSVHIPIMSYTSANITDLSRLINFII